MTWKTRLLCRAFKIWVIWTIIISIVLIPGIMLGAEDSKTVIANEIAVLDPVGNPTIHMVGETISLTFTDPDDENILYMITVLDGKLILAKSKNKKVVSHKVLIQ